MHLPLPLSSKQGVCLCVCGVSPGGEYSQVSARALPSVSNCDTVWSSGCQRYLYPSENSCSLPPDHPPHCSSTPITPYSKLPSLLPWPRESRLTDPSSRRSLSKFNTAEKQAAQSKQTGPAPVCFVPPRSSSLCPSRPLPLSTFRWRSYLVGPQSVVAVACPSVVNCVSLAGSGMLLANTPCESCVSDPGTNTSANTRINL